VTPTWQKVANLLGAKRLGHFSGEAATSLTLSSAAVASWTCLASGLVVSPGAAGTRPTYDAANKAVVFDGTDDFLAANSNPFLAAAAAGEVFAVAGQSALPADTTSRALVWMGNASSLNTSRVVDRTVASATNRVRARTGTGASNVSVTDVGSDLSGKHRIGVRWSATTTFAALDNGAEASGAAVPSTDTARVVIGAYGSAGANFWQGAVYEIIIAAPLTTGERAALHALYP
jgi:hypothetical protein